MRNHKKSSQSRLQSHEVTLKSYRNNSNYTKFTEIIQNYLQSMISLTFEISEISHVIVLIEILIEIIYTLKQEMNGSSD